MGVFGKPSQGPFTVGHLLHPIYPTDGFPDKGIPSYSCVLESASKAPRTPVLIGELYDVLMNTLDDGINHLWPWKGKEALHLATVMCHCALSLNIRRDMAQLEAMLGAAEVEELYVELFINLAEMVFLIYKIYRSVSDAKTMETNNRRRPVDLVGWPIFAGNKKLDEMLRHAMQAIRDNAPGLGFTADGLDTWIEERKGDEDYSIIYDNTSSKRKSGAITAVKTYLKDHTDNLRNLFKDVDRVKSGELRAWRKDPPPNYPVGTAGGAVYMNKNKQKGKDKAQV